MKAGLFAMVLCVFLVVAGCGKKADENKSVSEVKAEAETMSVEQLRKTAIAYKDAIVAKQGEITKLMEEVKKIPITEMLGEEAKALKADVDDLNESVKALKDRFEVYYDKLKEKKGDLSGLQI